MTGSGKGAGGLSAADLERKRRLGGLLNHLIAYFAAMIIVTPINAALDPHYPWFLFPLIGWGSVLAIHVAYVMGWWGKKLPPDQAVTDQSSEARPTIPDTDRDDRDV